MRKINSSIGVLLINLGTPQAPTTKAVRAYLREFLQDKRVINLPAFIWLPILYGLVLPFRAPKTTALYKKIWTPQGSPLLVHSLSVAEKLEAHLKDKAEKPIFVRLGMRYGEPSIAKAYAQLKDLGCDELHIVPLYPQYSASTTGAAWDAIADNLKKEWHLPAIYFHKHYADHPAYIKAIADSLQTHEAQYGKPEKWVFSFHGLPEKNLEQGDPYTCYCRKSARLITEKMGLGSQDWVLSFQSRFGAAKWASPYTIDTIIELAKTGTKHIALVCPGFAVDCLETLEEIQMQCKESFIKAGGETFHLVPALNDSPGQIHLLTDLLLNPSR